MTSHAPNAPWFASALLSDAPALHAAGSAVLVTLPLPELLLGPGGVEPVCHRAGAGYRASSSFSPVRTRTTDSTAATHTLPSPIRPVCADLAMMPTTSVAS